MFPAVCECEGSQTRCAGINANLLLQDLPQVLPASRIHLQHVSIIKTMPHHATPRLATLPLLCVPAHLPFLSFRFERKGFKLVGLKLYQTPKEVAEEHYKDLKEKPFYGKLVEYIVSGPVVAMVRGRGGPFQPLEHFGGQAAVAL